MPEMRRQAFRDLLEGKELMCKSFGELVASASSSSVTPTGELLFEARGSNTMSGGDDEEDSGRRKSKERPREDEDEDGGEGGNENKREPMLGGLLFADPRHAGGEWPSLPQRSPPAPEPWS